MPGKKGQRWTTKAQKKQIAIMRATGKTHKEVALAVGCTVKTSQAIATTPRMRANILDLKEQYSDKIAALMNQPVQLR